MSSGMGCESCLGDGFATMVCEPFRGALHGAMKGGRIRDVRSLQMYALFGALILLPPARSRR